MRGEMAKGSEERGDWLGQKLNLLQWMSLSILITLDIKRKVGHTQKEHIATT